jgi:hypothetical protein
MISDNPVNFHCYGKNCGRLTPEVANLPVGRRIVIVGDERFRDLGHVDDDGSPFSVSDSIRLMQVENKRLLSAQEDDGEMMENISPSFHCYYIPLDLGQKARRQAHDGNLPWIKLRSISKSTTRMRSMSADRRL